MKNKFLKLAFVIGMMASVSYINSNAATALNFGLDVVYTAQQAIQKESFYLQRGLQVPDKDAQYRGGLEAAKKFLARHIKYPVAAALAEVQGKVILELRIDEKGKVTHAFVLKSLHPLLDEEAIRVARLMPNFKPAKLNGEAIPSAFVMPITFRLR